MIARSGHIIFSKRVTHKQLAKYFPEILYMFLKESGQIPDDEAYLRIIIRNNMVDLLNNRKPEGYNREGKMRLIFPIRDDKIELYIYRSIKSEDVVKVTNMISKYLKAKKLSHIVEWDKMFLYKLKEKKYKRAEERAL